MSTPPMNLLVFNCMSGVAACSGGDEGCEPPDAADSGGSLTDLLLDDRHSEILAIILRALPER